MEFTEEKKQVLVDEMRTLLSEYGYSSTKIAVKKILDTWFANKKGLIDILSKHPNWNPDKWHIAFDEDYKRSVDADVVWDTLQKFVNLERQNTILQELVIDGKTYDEASGEYERLNLAKAVFNSGSCDKATTVVNGYKDGEWESPFRTALNFIRRFNGFRYTRESENKQKAFLNLLGIFKSYTSETVDDNTVVFIKRYLPSFSVRAGMKTSRVVNKLLQEFGVDRWTDENGEVPYNRIFAKYSDAINTLEVKRHTIISVNPIDYLTMSFGNSWSSCHTIDKKNKRDRGGNTYSGCYSSGTISYMLDGTSMVFYTVDKKYNGGDYELEDKINRNMFHFGENKLIQGRVYPQCNDSESGIYKTIREITQKVMADCLEVPNMWVAKKGTGYIGDFTTSQGTHYRDYTSYECCSISFLKDKENPNKISIGHKPMCVNSAKEHGYQATIQPYKDFAGTQLRGDYDD